MEHIDPTGKAQLDVGMAEIAWLGRGSRVGTRACRLNWCEREKEEEQEPVTTCHRGRGFLDLDTGLLAATLFNADHRFFRFRDGLL